MTITQLTPSQQLNMSTVVFNGISNYPVNNSLATSTITYTTTGNATATTTSNYNYYVDWDSSSMLQSDELTPDGAVRKIMLQDGTIIHIDGKGNYRIEDKDATVIYKANRMREFNPFVNAGDLLSDFIDYVRKTIPGVRRTDIPDLPLQLFVHWLILEAATRDGDDAPKDIVPVPESRLLKGIVKPQCVLPSCRRYIKRRFSTAGFNYCNPQHAGNHGKLLRA